jgi:hypothetical protein
MVIVAKRVDMNSRHYMYGVIIALIAIYSVFRLISVAINQLCDYHQKSRQILWIFLPIVKTKVKNFLNFIEYSKNHLDQIHIRAII